jgi:glycogen synthase
MKLAFVCDWFWPQVGGIENHIGDLARELAIRGHEVHVITSTPGPAAPRVHRLALLRVPRWHVVADPRVLAALRSLFARERFAVVHAHSLQSVLSHAAMYVARELGIASVLTQHSVLGPRATFGFRALAVQTGWSTWPTVITAVSSVAARRTGIAARRDDVRVVHTGLDLAQWARQPPARGPARVACVTRLVAHKHTEDLLHAIARVPDASFVIVGEGPERGRLERLAAQLGITARTVFAGLVPRTAIAGLLARSHVFVLPNAAEAFGIAALEARAVGLPVVARRQSGARDLIEHGVHGLLCETVDDMATAIAELCRDDVMRHAMARRARDGIERFGWPAAIERQLAIYQLACGESRQAAA